MARDDWHAMEADSGALIEPPCAINWFPIQTEPWMLLYLAKAYRDSCDREVEYQRTLITDLFPPRPPAPRPKQKRRGWLWKIIGE